MVEDDVWPLLMGSEMEYAVTGEFADAVVDAVEVPATRPAPGSHDRMLGNGGRFYVDHGHPEYATPEVRSVSALVLHEHAGDRVAARAAAAASVAHGATIRLHRNTTDGKGHSYGYHENLLMRRATDWATVVAALPAVLVTRTVIGGAGRVGLGRHGEEPGFQLSQRADFFERPCGLDTTRRRGIVNTRDEPHADPGRWRRLHVIAGDANRSPFATWLRAGILALSVAALEEGLLPVVTLADPVAAFRAVSRDLACAVPLELAEGRDTAVGLQERFRDAAARLCARHPFPEGDALVAAWTATLDLLRADPACLADRLDWAAKLRLLDALRERDGLAWDDPRLAALDLRWAALEPDGIVARLQRRGELPAPPPDAQVEAAASVAPTDTRARIRGGWISHRPDAVVAVGWDALLVRDTAGALHPLTLADPFRHHLAPTDDGTSVATLVEAHRAASEEENR